MLVALLIDTEAHVGDARATGSCPVVQIAPARHTVTKRRPIKLTEEERQILLAELAEVTAELNWLQGRTLDLASRVLNTSGTEEARTA